MCTLCNCLAPWTLYRGLCACENNEGNVHVVLPKFCMCSHLIKNVWKLRTSCCHRVVLNGLVIIIHNFCANCVQKTHTFATQYFHCLLFWPCLKNQCLKNSLMLTLSDQIKMGLHIYVCMQIYVNKKITLFFQIKNKKLNFRNLKIL